jgi:four helix bundle protein
MMRANRFEDLRVWQRATDLAVDVHRCTKRGEFARDFSLRDQVRRSSTSVMANIAEGFGRYRRAELRRFLIIARGSAAEVQSHLHLALRLDYIELEKHDKLQARYSELGRMITSLWLALGRGTDPPTPNA